MMDRMKRAPAVFFAHGSPMTALDRGPYSKALADFGGRCAGARGVVIVSAHWETAGGIRATHWEAAPLVYDFTGFPKELYQVQYPAPGSPALAEEAAQLARAAGFGVGFEERRGLDHGAWTPLVHAFPEARVPVVQVSLPDSAPAKQVFDLGRALRGLRESGVVVAGSGGIVHNLRRVNLRDPDAPVDEWAAEFDEWVEEMVAEGDWESLCDYAELAPNANEAVPTPEHFAPLLFAGGASWEDEGARVLCQGMEYGNLSMTSYEFG